MPKPTRESIEADNKFLNYENSLLTLYMFDTEYQAHKLPIRAQYTDEKNQTVIDASWYRSESPSDGYVVARYWAITNGKRAGRLNGPSIHSFQSLGQMGTRPPWAPFIVERLEKRKREFKAVAEIASSGSIRFVGCPHCKATDEIQRSNIVPIWEQGKLTEDAFIVDDDKPVEFDWEGQQPQSTYYCGACGETFEDATVDGSVLASDAKAIELIAEAAKSGAM